MPAATTCVEEKQKKKPDGNNINTYNTDAIGLGRQINCNPKRGQFYFDKHLERKHHGENVIGRAQKRPLVAVRRYVRSLHGQSDAIQRYKCEHRVVEPFLLDELSTRLPET